MDPVGSSVLSKAWQDLVATSLGFSMMTTELNSRRLQLLKEVTPQLTEVGVLWNPDHPFHAKVLEDLKAIAPSLSLELT